MENFKHYLLPMSIFAASVLISGSISYAVRYKNVQPEKKTEKENSEPLGIETTEISSVIPSEGVELPIKWGDLGKQLAESGVLDREKFELIYKLRGGLPEDIKRLLYEENGTVVMNSENSGILLNIFWALGLGNKNPILEKGPMTDPEYGGAAGFASTGGWTLSRGDVMNHYSKHEFVSLTPEQQTTVERVAQGIYRPCCGNSTYFQDCNHGMAMLGLLELLASQDVSEDDMYRVALKVNSYWFPETYLTLAKYFQKKGIEWKNVDPKEVLGSDYSSGMGYRKVLMEIEPPDSPKGGGGCSV